MRSSSCDSGVAAQPYLFKFGLDLMLYEVVPDRPVLKYGIRRWKVINSLRVIFSSRLSVVLTWFRLVKETCFGCALFSFCSLFQPNVLMTRAFTDSSHRRLYTMYVLFPLEVGILEQNLKQRDAFYENVFKRGFLFELSHWEQIYTILKNEVVTIQRHWFRGCNSPYEYMLE